MGKYAKEAVAKACRLAIQNVLKEGITDVELFNPFFEIEELKNEQVRNDLVDYIYEIISSCEGGMGKHSLRVRKNGSVLIPKKNLADFRSCSLTDVVDEIIYLTVIILFAPNIEKKRLNKSKKNIYSYRYEPSNGYLFDQSFNFTSFRTEVTNKGKLRGNNIVVECDIANFYDRLNLHRLESNLLTIEGISSSLVKGLNELLLFWANRDSYGLPIGSNASRMLAEAALIEVDNYLISKKIRFCRFVDDYRIFAKDAKDAYRNLSLLIERLHMEGLFLNSGKTKVKVINKADLKNSPSDAADLFVDPDEQLETVIEDNGVQKVSFEEIDYKKNLSKIIRGYSGLVPMKFRKLSDRERKELCNNDLNSMIKELTQKTCLLVEPAEITLLIKTIIAKEEYSKLELVPIILAKFPQLIPYFSDAFIKHEEYVDLDVIERIQHGFKVWFDDHDTPEYILVYIVRILSLGKLCNKEILFNYFRELKRNSGDYIGRVLLEALDGKLSRGELLEIRKYYTRADIWEKRQILKLIKNGLPESEMKAYFRDIRSMREEDFLIKKILGSKN